MRINFYAGSVCLVPCAADRRCILARTIADDIRIGIVLKGKMSEERTMEVTAALAQFVVGTRSESIPETVRHEAKRALLREVR